MNRDWIVLVDFFAAAGATAAVIHELGGSHWAAVMAAVAVLSALVGIAAAMCERSS